MLTIIESLFLYIFLALRPYSTGGIIILSTSTSFFNPLCFLGIVKISWVISLYGIISVLLLSILTILWFSVIVRLTERVLMLTNLPLKGFSI